MKKVFTLLSILFSITCFSQSISVSADKTIDELVNKVLINSPCILTSNITSRTGTSANFNSSNGIGYFENKNPNFPMKSGVILSTGAAVNAVGPNTTELSDGNDLWEGDEQLEKTLLLSGIEMKSTNATVLEFDFIPISQNFSFDFLFASEEYGTFQCVFSDAFAFLLTNKNTGFTTNLAVVPKTTIPISVVTIRDEAYNGQCSSENKSYFGSFNGGSNASKSATNFNGQTVLLNASSNLEVNTPYHIKLVIADRQNKDYDSAIFIASDSFNVGQEVLGPDIPSNSPNAPCPGTDYVLNSGLDPNFYTFRWTKNNKPIDDEIGPSLTIEEPGIYAIIYKIKNNTCDEIEDKIKVEYQLVTTIKKPIDLYKCNNATSGSLYDFDLSKNTPIVKTGLDPLTTVSYYASEIDAKNGENYLESIYKSAGNQKIYVRITIPNKTCIEIRDFSLLLAEPPTATKPSDMTTCADLITGVFNLTLQNSSILNLLLPSIYSVRYYTSQSDADSRQNAIPVPTVYVTNENKTIFARVETTTDSTCFSTTSFKIFVNLNPPVAILDEVISCGDYKLQPIPPGQGGYFSGPNGTGIPLLEGDPVTVSGPIYIYNKVGDCFSNSSFNVEIITIDELKKKIKIGPHCGGYSLPNIDPVEYWTKPGGLNGLGTPLNAGTLISASQTVYAYYQPCSIDEPFNIVINPEIALGDFDNVFDCNSYKLPTLTVGANYFKQPGGIEPITSIDITSSQTIYVYANTPENCPTEKSFEVVIGITPPPNVVQCDPYELPDLVVGSYYNGPGGTLPITDPKMINTSQRVYIYIPTSDALNCSDDNFFDVTIGAPLVDKLPNVMTCDFFTLPKLTTENQAYYTGPNGTGTPLYAGNNIYGKQKIYIYAQDATSTCSNQSEFEVSFIPKPNIDSRANIEECNSYTLTPLKVGKYYNGPNGSDEITETEITETQLIYIYAVSKDDPNCSIENSFTVNIVHLKADDPADVFSCGPYELPPLSPYNSYYKNPGGPSPTNPEVSATTIISTNTKLYVYTESDGRIPCVDENQFNITIATVPVANPVPTSLTTVCDEDGKNDGITLFNLSQLNATILGTQTSSEYKIQYFETQNDAITGNNPIVSTFLYTVFAKLSNTIATDCFDIITINITVNKLPELQIIGGALCFDTETNTLVNPYTIETGLSSAIYNFEWQDGNGVVVGIENYYTSTSPGTYSVIATNKTTNCSSPKVSATVTKSEPAIVVYTVSDDFINNQNITVYATGVGGDYVYQLDNNTFQENNVFENVDSGTHQITVKDKNGCGSTTVEALVINYPKYFTPNNDGYNDTWNIFDLQNQENATIFIYNKFGKLLKEIKPNGAGWNGIYNGQKMPSTDYWFVLTYDKDGEQTTFKSHFSLKR